MTKPVINLHPRGIGSGGGYPSLATGKPCDFGPDMAMFAGSRADAYLFADWAARDIEDGSGRSKRIDCCYIDYRPSEPNWLQVKVCVEKEDEAVLDRLYTAINVQGGYCDEEIVKWAIDPENNKQPYGVRIYNQLEACFLLPGGYHAKMPEGPRYFEPTDEERAALLELSRATDLSPGAVMRQALRLYQMNHFRLAAGETVSWSGDAQRAEEFAGGVEA